MNLQIANIAPSTKGLSLKGKANPNFSYSYITGDVVVNLKFAKNGNRKIAKLGELVVSTYIYGLEQVQTNDITKDGQNCQGCDFSYTNNDGSTGGCYAHKGTMGLGVRSKLRMLNKMYHNGEIVGFSDYSFMAFVDRVTTYDVSLVRHAVYGEGVMVPIKQFNKLNTLSDKVTCYTELFRDARFVAHMNTAMASVHNLKDFVDADILGYRKFCVISKNEVSDYSDALQNTVNCPASKEYMERTGKDVTCADCGMCNGLGGKVKKDINIFFH